MKILIRKTTVNRIIILVLAAIVGLSYYITKYIEPRKRFKTTVVEDVAPQTVVAPFTPSNYDQASDITGECWESIASSSDDAYRCSDNNSLLFDPCFKIDERKAACYIDPEDPADTIIVTQEKLEENSNKDSDRLPWVSVLEDGKRCYIMTGTSMVIEGKNYYLSCPTLESQDIYGEIISRDNQWKMKLVDYLGYKEDEYLNIVKVYR